MVISFALAMYAKRFPRWWLFSAKSSVPCSYACLLLSAAYSKVESKESQKKGGVVQFKLC